jgi:hypothetical protein
VIIPEHHRDQIAISLGIAGAAMTDDPGTPGAHTIRYDDRTWTAAYRGALQGEPIWHLTGPGHPDGILLDRYGVVGAVTEPLATLIINVTESRCGRCGKPVMMQASRHTDVSGWPGQPGGGCGARFVDTSTDYPMITPDRLRAARPDLPVRDEQGDEDVLDDADSSILAADYTGPGVYRPETDPVRIAAAEERLDQIRKRLNRPAW